MICMYVVVLFLSVYVCTYSIAALLTQTHDPPILYHLGHDPSEAVSDVLHTYIMHVHHTLTTNILRIHFHTVQPHVPSYIHTHTYIYTQSWVMCVTIHGPATNKGLKAERLVL